MTTMTTMFDPIKVGALELPNRIIMAPLTRSRAVGPGRVPNAMMAEYYVQRASAGLILSEATAVTPMGVGYADTPGIWSDEQVEGWKVVTEAVHKAGGRIVLQLWHVGRISDPVFLDGQLPVAPSSIAPKGHVSLVRPKRDYATPRALETDEIAGIVAAYRKGAENAKLAGLTALGATGAAPSRKTGSEIRPTCQSCMTMRPPAACTASVICFQPATWASDQMPGVSA